MRKSLLPLLLAMTPSAIIFAQTTPAASAPQSDEVIVLSPFEVTGSKPARYQAAETASGGRIRTDIADTPMSVSVLTQDFIGDLGTSKVLDAAKYVAGVGEATIPNGLDRVNIRGFQSDGRRVDGFSTSDQANYDTAAIDRMEIVKGPDSLLQPRGIPGGTINLVTKQPQFKQAAYITGQIAYYDDYRIEADSTGPICKNLAYRVVGAYENRDGYVDKTWRESTLLAPSIAWRITPTTLLTVRYEYYQFGSNDSSIPVDPSVGTNDKFQLLKGVARTFSPSSGNHDEDYRKSTSNTATALLTSSINDHLSVRLAARYAEMDTPNAGLGWGAVGDGGAYDPKTGLWVGGTVFGKTAPYTAAPAVPQSRTFKHTGTQQLQKLYYRDLQNDWVYTIGYENIVNTVTGAGLAYIYEHQNLNARNITGVPFNVDNYVPNYSFIYDPIAGGYQYSTRRRRDMSSLQVYLTERVELLNKRIILSGGLTNVHYDGYYTQNEVTTPGSNDANTVSYGIVVKPFEPVSLYYGHSENASPSTNYASVAAGSPAFTKGKQNEVGLKFELLQKRLIGSVAYYKINQSGYSLANPGNLVSPAPVPLLPPLIMDRIAKGVEFQVTAALTKQLSFIASYTDAKNRDPNDVPFRGAAEKMAAAYVHYEFTNTLFKGFGVGLGANYSGKAAGDQAPSGYAAASTASHPIPFQPSFYLPAYACVNLNMSYKLQKHWLIRLNIYNLLNEDIYTSAGARSGVNIGNPFNMSGSVTFKF